MNEMVEMSKRMEKKEVVGTVDKEELMKILEEVGSVDGRGNGVVQRIRELVLQVLDIKNEVSVGYMNRVVSKMEGREVDYSVVRYSVMKMDDVEMFKKGRNNWIRKK